MTIFGYLDDAYPDPQPRILPILWDASKSTPGPSLLFNICLSHPPGSMRVEEFGWDESFTIAKCQ